jgi:hypothetical protein
VLAFKDTKKGHEYEGKLEGKVLTATSKGFSGAANAPTTGGWKLEITKQRRHAEPLDSLRNRSVFVL